MYVINSVTLSLKYEITIQYENNFNFCYLNSGNAYRRVVPYYLTYNCMPV